jgi:hypothetical protein
MSTFTFYSDPGHGWLEVHFSHFRDLGLNPRDFSHYSYRRRNTFYLEEDCDAPKFLAAYKAKHGDPVIRESQDGAFIRNLEPIY